MLNNLLLSIWSYLYGTDKTDTQLEAEYAVMKNDIDAFKKLHTSGLDINTSIKGPFDGAYSTFLEMSIRYKAYDITQYLVDQNVEINITLFGEHPPLHYAIWHKDNKLFDIFMSHKNLDVNKLMTIFDETTHPLMLAYIANNFHAFSKIVDDERTDFSIKDGLEHPAYPVMKCIEIEELKNDPHLKPMNFKDPAVILKDICLDEAEEIGKSGNTTPSEYMLKLFSNPKALHIIDKDFIKDLKKSSHNIVISTDATYEEFERDVRGLKHHIQYSLSSYIKKCKEAVKARDEAAAEKSEEIISNTVGTEDTSELVQQNPTESEHNS